MALFGVVNYCRRLDLGRQECQRCLRMRLRRSIRLTVGYSREREAVREAPSVPVDASVAVSKGMVAVSDSSWPWGAPCPVRDPARG